MVSQSVGPPAPAPSPAPPQLRAEQWFQNPIQSITVKTLGAFSATADGACPVELPDGSRGYVKPRPNAAQNLVVAREKITSDLGRMLGVPVAAVVVREPEKNTWPHHSALSEDSLVAARHWGAGGNQHLNTVAEVLEGLRVFWTWIGDKDHNGHGQNLLYAVGASGPEVLAIDHGQSLCFGNQNDPLAVPVSQGYGTGQIAGRDVWSQAMIDKITSLDWSKVEGVVRRLHPILTTAEQDRHLRILTGRREHLPTFLK